MHYKNYIAITLAAAFMVFGGCSSDYLDTTPTSYVPKDAMSTLNNLYVALNGIHRNMVSQGISMGGEPGFIVGREAHGDDMTWDTQLRYQTHHTWAINTDETSLYNTGIWKTYYEFIMNANMILENLEEYFSDSSDEMAGYIKGECLCIRAWAHFQLVQYYAKRYVAGSDNTQLGVPYRESSDLTAEMARHTVENVYTYITRDLGQAITLLDGYKANDINHYTQKVAYGLKARVALVQQDYTNAAAHAAKVIETAESEGHKIMTKNQLMNGFADISTDTKDALYAALTQDDQTVYFASFYALMSWNFSSNAIRSGIKCISQTTYDLMSPTDLRRQWWDPTGTASVPGTVFNKRVYQNRKFTARSTSSAVGDFAFMRLSEMYLIAAEAYVRAGDNSLARQYFNAFVAERDPSYTDSGNTGEALAKEIMNHRRIELWGEGFRWFDLKRLDLPCYRTGSNFDETFCGFLKRELTEVGWYYEIPKIETDNNSLMVKNY